MTLKGKNNHYDIKILSGFGCGISVTNQRLVLKNGIDVFTKKQEIETFIPTTIPYSRIVICGRGGYLSTKAIELLAANHINTIFLDSFGNLVSSLSGQMSSFTGISRRMGQYDTFRDGVKVLELQKNLVQSKLESQINFVTDGSVREKLIFHMENIPNCSSYKQIIGIEAKAGIVFRAYYVELFDTKYEFSTNKTLMIGLKQYCLSNLTSQTIPYFSENGTNKTTSKQTNHSS